MDKLLIMLFEYCEVQTDSMFFTVGKGGTRLRRAYGKLPRLYDRKQVQDGSTQVVYVCDGVILG